MKTNQPTEEPDTVATSHRVQRLVRPSYIIRLNPEGFYSGGRAYQAVIREEATVFPSMKDARKQLNRIHHLMKSGSASILPNVKLNRWCDKAAD